MATNFDLTKGPGGGQPVIMGVYAVGSLPAASAANLGAIAVATGTGHATETTQLVVSNGTTWCYASDGITTASA
jgi:hypothetical protein